MMVPRSILSVSAWVAALAGGGGALAQTSAQQAAHAQATLAQARSTASQALSSWPCPFADIELAPVSHDTAGRPSEWVMVHRVKGEIVAAERVRATEVQQIRAMPCATARPASPAPLVG